MEASNFTAQFVALCVNASDQNFASEFWEIAEKTGGKVRAALILLLAVVGLPWNLIIVATIVKKRLYKQPTIMLLLNVVMADLLLLLFMLLIQAVAGITGKFGGTRTNFSDRERCNLCKAGIMTFIFTFVSLYTISLMAFDRFLFIYRPMRYERLITSTRMFAVLSVMWLICFLVAGLPLLGFSEIVFFPSALGCQAVIQTRGGSNSSTVAYSVLVICFSAIAVIFLIVFDLWVVAIVVRNIKAIYSVKKSVNAQAEVFKWMKKQRHEKQLHLVKVFGTLLCCNLIAWLPGLIVSIWAMGAEVPYPVYFIVNISFVSQVVTHPFTETFLIKELMGPIKKMLCCDSLRENKKCQAGNESGYNSCQSCYHADGDDDDSETAVGCGMFLLINAAILHHSYLHDSNTHHRV